MSKWRPATNPHTDNALAAAPSTGGRRALPTPLGLLRAGAQISAAGGLTLGHVAYRAGLDRIHWQDPIIVARQASLWGTQLCALTGLEVVCTGTPPTSGVMMMSNHRSYSDIIALLSQVPACFLSKADLAQWPVLGWAANIARTVYVQRDDPDSRKRAGAALTALLEQGVSTLVFPEGTTFDGPGIMGFKRGGFRIAVEAGVPVVPVAITYPSRRDAWVGEEAFLHHYFDRYARGGGTTAHVAFGPPLSSSDPEALAQETAAWIRDALVKLGEPAI